MNGTSFATITRPGSPDGGGEIGGRGDGDVVGVGGGATDGGGVSPICWDGDAVRPADGDGSTAGERPGSDGAGGAELHAATSSTTTVGSTRPVHVRPTDFVSVPSRGSRRPERGPSRSMVPSTL